ncbi:hypothetical protein ACFWH1_18330 [Streptomyces sp. NPDC127037]|uniref:hypothetical protein n=1 Tax=Streptomyces sp. NPDC127037 TaxID=3347113 RepID=UPI0036547628
MARKQITLNTEPHVVEIGADELLFQPEVMGDEFVEAFTDFREAVLVANGVDLDDMDSLTPENLRSIASGMRTFLARLMLPESAELFTRVDVTGADGEVLGSFQSWADATAFVDGLSGQTGKPRWAMRLPDRVLVEIMEFVVELYGGGADQRPPTSPSASASGSRKGGRRGTAVLPSKASTRTPGR